MANGLFSSLLPGLATSAGYYDLWKDIDKNKGDVGNFFGDLRSGIDDRTQFTPWTIRGGVGNVAGGPDGMKFGLNDQMKNMSNNMFGRGGQMFNRAMQDIAPRQQEIYEAMRATQRPGEQRAMEEMEGRLFSQGRMGSGSSTYGGTPEQLAFEKARAEADNSAFFGARDAAMGEQMQQYNMGQGFNQMGYTPYDYMYKQAGYGLDNQKMNNQMMLNNAQLWAELGLGEQSARQNYQNIQSKMQGDFLTSMAPMLSGIGSGIDSWSADRGGWRNILGDGWDLAKSIFR